jgi:starch synthase
MKVAFAAAEAVPFCKTGGLADVAGALPQALRAIGIDVTLFIPYYQTVRERFPDAPVVAEIAPRIHGDLTPTLLRRVSDAILVDCPKYFDREGLYGVAGKDFPDNAERYALFAQATIEGALKLELQPEIFHCHDWQSGLIPAYLKAAKLGVASVFTIHNLAYQGNFQPQALAMAGLPESMCTSDGLEFYEKVSYLKSGLAFADVINAVSPRYAQEIRTKDYGAGMDVLLRARDKDLFGILNGLDGETWNPQTDSALPMNYGADDAASGKAACKHAAQIEGGLTVSPEAMLVSMVTRLDRQKGIDIALTALSEIVGQGAQVILIGTGDAKLQAAAQKFAEAHPGRVCYRDTFDDPFARRTYAGSDVFLMPSLFEPCGLGQLIAMRYGALPVATRTGGLADTVEPSGWLADQPDATAIAVKLAEAKAAFARADWAGRVTAAMRRDFSWNNSAEKYKELYQTALQRRSLGTPS